MMSVWDEARPGRLRVVGAVLVWASVAGLSWSDVAEARFLAQLTTLPAEGAPAVPLDGAEASVHTRGLEAVVIHDGEVEHLVLHASYRVEGKSPALGWVVPVPALPDSYGTNASRLFTDVRSWMRPRAQADADNAQARLIEPINEARAKVGPYEVLSLRGTGEAGEEALRQWIERNGFAKIPRSELRYYVERGWTFLVVRVQPRDPQERSSMPPFGELPPLRLTFKTPRAVAPLKLMVQDAPFPAVVYLFTPRELRAADFQQALQNGLEVAAAPEAPHLSAVSPPKLPLVSDVMRFKRSEAPDTLKRLLERAKVGEDDAPVFGRVVYASELGTEREDPRLWAEEVVIPALKSGETAQGAPQPPRTYRGPDDGVSMPPEDAPDGAGDSSAGAPVAAEPSPSPAAQGGAGQAPPGKKACGSCAALGATPARPLSGLAWAAGLLILCAAARRQRGAGSEADPPEQRPLP